MTNVINYVTNVQQSAATYTYYVDKPTMTGPRVTAIGTGTFTLYTFYIKVIVTLLGQFVIFNDKLDCGR